MKKIIFTLIMFSFFLSCSSMQSNPDCDDYQCNECFVAVSCLYRVKSETDKTSCAILIEDCRNAMKEKRKIDKIIFCREKTPAGLTEETCRLWIDQK